ncbi:helix-turn-helix transcriptional regulator [Mycobacterium paragordonae]|uniref:Winged helix-turn-helix transcriptional regulator n=1 Tax=Mycobacterium paragordonae TaxID=1389713 RepID=A0A4R5WN64_9MYCO|nr:HTH domain-containing protein [Mycobacterium paragordonae]MDP7736460.1 winged helix-turn-helix transcriptional regulator [Mycobacterium paragordonae]TDK92782.1 winged helix-turn-helix transcriptional regulator [Mycobacterium paragordonae]TDL04788.1 winged helix-turn-helix transcriptional regulator [Mycobacterium paragordonae]
MATGREDDRVGEHDKGEAGRAHRAGRSLQRQRVLELVREHDEPVDADELAARLGLHTTTVRFHLDALCDDGVVERTRITRAGVGRPRTGYLAVRERLDYRILAEILALELGDTADKRRRRAAAAGRRWGERIADDVRYEDTAGQRVPDDVGPANPVEERSAMITTMFARMGFGPELTPAGKSAPGNQRTIRLHSCPVRDLARDHPEVACALHGGLLQGLVAKSAAHERSSAIPGPRMQTELKPFVEPELCLARVIARD